MRKQEVRLGRTESGKPGFFTNGFLAHSLSEEVYEVLKKDDHKAKQKAESLGFTYSQILSTK